MSKANGTDKSASRSISAPFAFWETVDFLTEYYEISLSELVRESVYLYVSVKQAAEPEWRYKLKQKAKTLQAK